KSNQAKMPPTDYYVDAAVAHHEAMKQYGLYNTLNRLTANCPFDCLDNHYTGDLGILELAGNPARWLDGLVPEKANWLDRFISSVKSSTAVQ
ncbi:MAG: hypothetical protein Q7O66_07185, partial [Dehalococcoidia bacterium]|nr:hypothetical protein [Dehalococcoidia bacterium]